MSRLILRSLLFVPANNWRMMLRALKEYTDAIVLDMEDAVPVEDKETARWFVSEYLKILPDERPIIMVRINSWTTELTSKDLHFVINKGLDCIVLPKTSSAKDIERLDHEISKFEQKRGLNKGSIKILPLLETALGIENAKEIATASERIIGLSFGIGDFLRDMGLDYKDLSNEQYEVLYPRSKIAVIARSLDLIAIDAPFLGMIIDREGLMKESLLAKKLGFKGKFAIHPSHIPIINEIFTPSIEEINEAKEIVEIYEKTLKKGIGVASYRGIMIDYMHYKRAKEVLETINTIKSKKKCKMVTMII